MAFHLKYFVKNKTKKKTQQKTQNDSGGDIRKNKPKFVIQLENTQDENKIQLNHNYIIGKSIGRFSMAL